MALQLYKDIAHGPEGKKDVVVFVDPYGARREVTDYSGDTSTLQQYTGTTGTAGGNVSYQGAQDIFTGYEQDQQRIAQNKAAEEAQAISNEQIALQQSQKFRPRNEGEGMTSYLQQKQAYEMQTMGSSTVNLGQQVAQQQPQQPIQQPTQPTPPAQQPLNTNPTSYYKVNTGNTGVDGRPAYDIYDALTNQKISAEQGTPLFAGGLNVEFIPEKPVPGQQPSQPPQTQQPAQTAQTSTPAGQPATGQAGASGGVPTAPTLPDVTQKPYVQYEGSPDVFERSTGTYIPAEQAEKIPDFFSKVEQAKTVRPGVTTEEDFAKLAKTNLQLQQSGATTTPEDFQNNPLKAFQDTYSQIWSNLGLGSVKEQIETTLKAMKEVDNEMIDKIAEVNDNPWLSESLRSKKVTQLQDTYKQKNATNTGNLKLLQSLFESGQQEAQFVTTNALNAFHKQQTFDQQILLKQMEMAEKRVTALDKKSFQDLVGADGRMHTYIVSDETGEKLVDLGVSELPKAGGGDGGLTPAQMQTTINQIVGSFDNEQVVKNYNIVSEGYQFAKGLGTKKTPTSSDDQGLIYAFAKAMDPNSVVREGEYATVQKYAQSWAESFGFKAERIFSNTVFLTKEARQNMIDTIKSKFSVSEKNYQNVSKEYQRRIEDVKLGKVGGSITDYSKAFQDNTTEPTGDLPSLSNQEAGVQNATAVLDSILQAPASAPKKESIFNKNPLEMIWNKLFK